MKVVDSYIKNYKQMQVIVFKWWNLKSCWISSMLVPISQMSQFNLPLDHETFIIEFTFYFDMIIIFIVLVIHSYAIFLF